METTLENYINWTKEEAEFGFEPLLADKNKLKVYEDSGIYLSLRKYKKLLVINEHEFLLASKTEIIKDE